MGKFYKDPTADIAVRRVFMEQKRNENKMREKERKEKMGNTRIKRYDKVQNMARSKSEVSLF